MYHLEKVYISVGCSRVIIESTFKPAWWLKNAHLQTIYPTVARYQKPLATVNERLELPDGDFVDLAWVTQGLKPDAPLVILLHGLGGNVRSSYIAGLFRSLNHAGFRCVLMHFRGASHEPNRLLRAYHAGDTGDFSFLLEVLNQREPHTKKSAIGVSLGGNVLLKWLGENDSQSLIQAAVAISPPFQLELFADRMSRGFGRLYQAYLLKRVRGVYLKKLKSFSGDFPYSAAELNALKCFWTFDHAVTARLHAFSDVHTYYRESSSKQYLAHIKTPTLIIHSLDDPFIPVAAVPKSNELSSSITLELSQFGGHVGFVGGTVPGKPMYWLDKRVPQFLQDVDS